MPDPGNSELQYVFNFIQDSWAIIMALVGALWHASSVSYKLNNLDDKVEKHIQREEKIEERDQERKDELIQKLQDALNKEKQ